MWFLLKTIQTLALDEHSRIKRRSADHYSERRINGSLDDLLFPRHHENFLYSAWKSFHRLQSTKATKSIKKALKERLRTMSTSDPLHYEAGMQNITISPR